MDRNGAIDYWDDTRIQAGQEWRKEIQKAIDRAHVAILIWSADFLASDYIVENELPPLLEKAEKEGLTVLQLVASPCNIPDDLRKYQAVGDLSKSLTKMSTGNREEVFKKAAADVARILSQPTVAPLDVIEHEVPPSGLDHDEFASALGSLSSDRLFVIRQPASEENIEAFRTEITEARRRSDLKSLFQLAGRYERRKRYEPAVRYGLALRVFKGPFVQGSNWAGINAREFDRGLERSLVGQFSKQLESGLQPSVEAHSWEDVRRFISTEAGRIESEGGHTDLVVLQGVLPEQFRDEFWRFIEIGEARMVRGMDVPQELLGGFSVAGRPLLLHQEQEFTPAVGLVDLDRFHYVQTNPSPMNDLEIDLRMEPIDWESAVRSLRKDDSIPSWLERSLDLDHLPNPEESVAYLQEFIGLFLFEAGFIETVEAGSTPGCVRLS